MATGDLIDRAIKYYANKVSYYRALTTDSLNNTAPRHIVTDVSNPFYGMAFDSEEQLQKAMAVIAWIYSDISLLAKTVWSTELFIRKKAPNGKTVNDKEHPFLKIYQSPNEWMTKSFLIDYLLGWLLTSKKGAFAFLAPYSETGELAEIWPINSNQIEPVQGSHFVEKFIYYPTGDKDRRPFLIDRKHILWIRYADRFNYWGSMPPLRAAISTAEIELGLQDSQKKLYVESRGVPLTIVSLDPNLNEPNFASARDTIRADWENAGTSVAVARGGTISTASIGFSQAEMQTITAQKMTRDIIDSVFFGYAFRSEEFASGEGLKEMDRIIKEQAIRPLLIMLQDHIQAQVINRFYGDEDIIAEYKDPRTADRALNIQEAMIYSRWRTIDEMRERDGDPPLEDIPDMPGLGNMLVQQALNSAFLTTYYELAPDNNEKALAEGDKAQTEVGNLPNSQDPESLTNQLARGGEPASGNEISLKAMIKSLSPAEKLGVRTELQRWRTVAKRQMTKSGDAKDREFESEVLPDELAKEIKADLFANIDDEELEEVFGTWLAQLN